MINDIKKAASLIKNGNLVAFPTETVYGLGADALNQEACLKIFKAKQRPSNNPLIVHVNSLEIAQKIAKFNNDADVLTKLWPGPLSMVLPIKKDYKFLASAVTAGLDTVAIRIPANSTALKLLELSGTPIAAPSANKSGMLSPTSFSHVKKSLYNQNVDILTDQDQNKDSFLKCGLESTIIDLTTKTPTILRYGFITPEIIENLLGKKVKVASEDSPIKSPGMLLRHYAPKTKVKLNSIESENNSVSLNFADSKLKTKYSLNLSEKGDLAEAASNLFAYLHELDEICQEKNIAKILIAPIPNISVGLAINDRLKRAANS